MGLPQVIVNSPHSSSPLKVKATADSQVNVDISRIREIVQLLHSLTTKKATSRILDTLLVIIIWLHFVYC